MYLCVCMFVCVTQISPYMNIHGSKKNCMSIHHTIDAMFAAKAAAVVKDVKNVALPAVAIVYRVLPLIFSI